MTVHSFSTQYKHSSSDNLPSYLQTNITAQMLSIRGEGVHTFPHNSATKSPLVTLGRSKFTPKTAPSHSPITTLI